MIDLVEDFDNVRYIVYSTLDSSDFIVCFKSKKYVDVIQIINKLYQSLNKEGTVTYIYTNFIVHKAVINNLETHFQEDEMIDSICIKMVFNNKFLAVRNVKVADRLKIIEDKLQEALYQNCDIEKDKEKEGKEEKEENDCKAYEILGETDCRFIARKVKLIKLLGLFSDNGFLCKNNPESEYSNWFLSSITSLNSYLKSDVESLSEADNTGSKTELDEGYVSNKKDSIEDVKNPRETDNIGSVSKSGKEDGLRANDSSTPQSSTDNVGVLIEKLTNMKQWFDKYRSYSSVYNQLFSIVNYLSYMEKQGTQKYEFKLLFYPVQTVINLLVAKLYDSSNDIKRVNFPELYRYISNIYINVLGNIRTDIRTFNITDFGMVSYYSPAKLRAFYAKIIVDISDYYKSMCESDVALRYDFIIVPTNNFHTNVDQLWKEEIKSDKLMATYVSEKDFYNIKDLLFQLAHEAAHFVGNNEIRKREKRFNIILDYIIIDLYNQFKNLILSRIKGESKGNYNGKECINLQNVWDIFESEISCVEFYKEMRVKCFGAIIDYIENDNSICDWDEFYYLHNIQYHLPFIFSSDLLIKMSKYFTKKLRKCSKKIKFDYPDFTIEQIISFLAEIDEVEKYLIKNIDELKGVFYEPGNFPPLLSLMKECYSDLSGVIAFKLSITDLFSLVSSRVDNYKEHSLFIRACIVTKVLSELNDRNSLIDESFKFVLVENSNIISERYEIDLNMVMDIQEICSKISDKNDNLLIYATYKYIKECAESQIDINEKSEITKKIRERLTKIYKSVCMSNSQQLINEINSYLINEYND